MQHHKLYQTSQYPDSWIVQSCEGTRFMFPAKLDGWEERQIAVGLDTIRLREVPLSLGFNTGMPGTYYDEAGQKAHDRNVASPAPAPVVIDEPQPSARSREPQDAPPHSRCALSPPAPSVPDPKTTKPAL